MLRVGIGLGTAAAGLDGLAKTERVHRLATAVSAAGLDHVVTGDHISFRGGFGSDGLVEAALLLGAFPSLSVHLGVYLLPLRHPVLVARQIATVAEFAPGRLHFGVGVGGEDRHEIEVAGVDPATRGQRTDEALAVLVRLLQGDSVTHHGKFFDFDDALVLPAPSPPVPVVVGGRSEAALGRAGRYADGWLGMWMSLERFAAATAQVETFAVEAGRDGIAWDHGLLTWCGFGSSVEQGRAYVSERLEAMYKLPFSKFERYTPLGRPEDVAASLRPYVAAGARHFDLVAAGASPEDTVEAVAEVRRLLLADVPSLDDVPAGAAIKLGSGTGAIGTPT